MISLDHPLVLVLAGTIFPTLLGLLAYKRGIVADKSAEKYNLVDNLQEDNKVLREEIRDCRIEIKNLHVEIGGCAAKLEQVLEEMRKLSTK